MSWAALRSMVEGAVHGATITAEHVAYLAGRSKFVQGELEVVHETSVTLVGGQVIPFDYLVLATGNEGGVGKAVQKTRAARFPSLHANSFLHAAAPSLVPRPTRRSGWPTSTRRRSG